MSSNAADSASSGSVLSISWSKDSSSSSSAAGRMVVGSFTTAAFGRTSASGRAEVDSASFDAGSDCGSIKEMRTSGARA